jgi:hypothetical protein
MAGFFSSFFAPGHTPGKSDISSHYPGTARGEAWVRVRGREPGRDDPEADRTARDSTSVNAEGREPIDPRMPHIPPA